MMEKKGGPLPLGVSERDGYLNFSVAVESGKTCVLKLFEKGKEEPVTELVLPEGDAVGEVRFTAFPKEQAQGLEYCYEIDGKDFVDPYAKSVIEEGDTHIRGRICPKDYDWEEDRPLQIPYHEVIAYSLHVRGFTKDKSAKVKKKGTFCGIIEKIPYLTELGINQIQCMPVYSFEESKQYKNYWGYGEAFCFAVKNRYAAGADPESELKDMVKACHRAGIEVVLSLPFTANTPKPLMMECVRYYVMEYHIDGFIVNPYVAPIDSMQSDPLLKKTKILQNKDAFQYVMRRFLKGDEGMVESVMQCLRASAKENGSCNYITNHTGFTMADLVSYDEKHNEDNGENNEDGPDYNCSWNCGVEGPTRKKAVVALRKRQVRNAFFLLLSAQGTPCILAGDEFGNSQKGNNNVYCQDNELAWLNWKQLEKDPELFEYVKRLIALRKKYSCLHSEKPLLGVDQTSCGVPDVSFHGASAWQAPTGMPSRQLGVYYHQAEAEISDCFIAYNMYSDAHLFALPTLPKGKKWYCVFSTERAVWEEVERPAADQKETMVEGRTIVMYVGR